MVFACARWSISRSRSSL
jgi:hypothetical protein